MNTWKTQCEFPIGTMVKGKWHNGYYRLVKELGSGANGVVYLAKSPTDQVALKMSTDSLSITSEVNVLKAFAKVQGSSLGPSLYDVDDWESPKGRIHFYVMEYIQGPDLLTFIQKGGKSWAGIMIVQLLDVLEALHNQGWVFGDLKPENLIVSGPPPKIRCIDVGGTTIMGRAIKEFTEFYDRGYWGLGSRKAERSYDLFSTAMMLMNLYYPQRFTKKTDSYQLLVDKIRVHPELVRYEPVLLKALTGKYKTAKEMKEDLLNLLSEEKKPQPKSRQTRTPKRKQKRSKVIGFVETALVVTLTMILYALYIFGYIL